MGQNLLVFLFPAVGKDNQKIADAKKAGSFAVNIGKLEYKWRLPLGSVVPPKICPKCGEKLSGAYTYCPYDGTKLPEN